MSASATQGGHNQYVLQLTATMTTRCCHSTNCSHSQKQLIIALMQWWWKNLQGTSELWFTCKTTLKTEEDDITVSFQVTNLANDSSRGFWSLLQKKDKWQCYWTSNSYATKQTRAGNSLLILHQIWLGKHNSLLPVYVMAKIWEYNTVFE